ncbi:Wzz/FepE/Etk N-terminal domain-containing protein [Pseudomonas sp. DWP1b1]
MASDQIDLVALFHNIWKQKLVVLVITVLFGALGLIFTLSIPKEYAVSSLLRPTAINDLDALNRSQVYTLPPTEALNKVGARLDSYEARFGFFKAHPELFDAFNKPGQTLEQGFESFNSNSISLVLPDPKKTELSSYIRLDMRYPDGVDGVAILNGFVDFAVAMERQQIGADLKVIVENRLAEVQGKISAARSNYETDKESKIAQILESDNIRQAKLKDELAGIRLQTNITRTNRISELSEAISIAKSMGIKYPSTPSSISSASQVGANQIMRTEVNNQTIPLYFLGTEALEAERAILKQRSSDDFESQRIAEIAKELKLLEVNREVEVLNQRKNEDIFLQNIEPLRTERARLRNINTNMSALELVSIDRRAQEPIGPLKVSKITILGLALFVGFILGVILALFRQLVLDRRSSLADLPVSTFDIPKVIKDS